MKLIIVHYHLRPGGIRRVIELALPALVRFAPRPITEVVLATGECASADWPAQLEGKLPAVTLSVCCEPAFGYLSEQRQPAPTITRKIRRALAQLLQGADAQNCLVWAHNLGVGRNLILARELAAACAAQAVPLLSHHHDWWFDHRWARWPEIRRSGFRTLRAAAEAVLPPQTLIKHLAINQTDAARLREHLHQHHNWLPNPAGPLAQPTVQKIRQARSWLNDLNGQTHQPVWLLPCRTLRRKNIAEALLLARWLRPEACVVVTGGASSAEEHAYFKTLADAAQRHDWPLKLGVLAGHETRKPTVAELLAASEAVLLTSIQEGFGLPYLEAAAAQRPLIARRLPNIAPDLHRFGFRFPQAYDDVLIAPELFDWSAERDRQRHGFVRWRTLLPHQLAKIVQPPALLKSPRPRPIAFSQLTLAAQLEVLARPPAESWESVAQLNPFLMTWRKRSQVGRLQISRWPDQAEHWLGGTAYARKFFQAAHTLTSPSRAAALATQQAFIWTQLTKQNQFPLLWPNPD